MKDDVTEKGIIGFLENGFDKKDLATCLDVLRHFKNCESQHEWLAISFSAWAKLEQFEEFLGYLVDGTELRPDSVERAKQMGVKL